MARGQRQADQYRTWIDMPYAAINKMDAEEKKQRIEAMRKMTEGLPEDAFADEADIPESDTIGTYRQAGTLVESWGRFDVYEGGEDNA